MPNSAPLMVGGMVIFMVMGMVLVMVAMHLLHSSHRSQYGATSHQMHQVLPVANWMIKVLLRLGIRVTILGPMMLLTVRGRKTGNPHTIPIDVHEHDGRRFLIATHGEGHWVRNLRVAREGVLRLGLKRQPFTARELPPEAGGLVIKEVLGPLLTTSGVRGIALRQNFGIAANASLDEFVQVARSHPVFEIASPGSAPV